MKVETMAVTNKPIKVVDTKVYNTELIYSRVMILQASSRVLTSERLCHVSCHLYQLHFSMTLERCESLNQKQIIIKISTPEATCTVIDGCVLLWIPQWPVSTSANSNGFHKEVRASYMNHFGDLYI